MSRALTPVAPTHHGYLVPSVSCGQHMPALIRCILPFCPSRPSQSLLGITAYMKGPRVPMTVREINTAVRAGRALYARGQFRAYRVYGARLRRGQRELQVCFGVVDGKRCEAWVPVRGFAMVVEAKDGSIL